MDEEIDSAVRSIEEIEIQNSTNNIDITAEEVIDMENINIQSTESDPDYVPETESRKKSTEQLSICPVCKCSISSKSLARHLRNQHNTTKKSINSEPTVPYDLALRMVEKGLVNKFDPTAQQRVALRPSNNISPNKSNKNGGVFTKSGFTYEDITPETENDQNSADGRILPKYMCCICNRKFSDLAKFHTHLEFHR